MYLIMTVSYMWNCFEEEKVCNFCGFIKNTKVIFVLQNGKYCMWNMTLETQVSTHYILRLCDHKTFHIYDNS